MDERLPSLLPLPFPKLQEDYNFKTEQKIDITTPLSVN